MPRRHRVVVPHRARRHASLELERTAIRSHLCKHRARQYAIARFGPWAKEGWQLRGALDAIEVAVVDVKLVLVGNVPPVAAAPKPVAQHPQLAILMHVFGHAFVQALLLVQAVGSRGARTRREQCLRPLHRRLLDSVCINGRLLDRTSVCITVRP